MFSHRHLSLFPDGIQCLPNLRQFARFLPGRKYLHDTLPVLDLLLRAQLKRRITKSLRCISADAESKGIERPSAGFAVCAVAATPICDSNYGY